VEEVAVGASAVEEEERGREGGWGREGRKGKHSSLDLLRNPKRCLWILACCKFDCTNLYIVESFVWRRTERVG
jgi:hypothetical protein